MVTLSKYGAKYNRLVLRLEGLSSETKPTVYFIEYADNGREISKMQIQNGSVFTEIDTGDTYMYDADNAAWYQVSIGGGGGSPSDAYATAISLTIDSSTYVMTAQLLNKDGDPLGTPQTIDLPLESMVVNGSYNSQTKKVILTLKNGNTVEFSIADLVAGLQTELSATNKLNPAYIDYDSTHTAVTTAEKTKLDDLANIKSIGTGLSLNSSTGELTTTGDYTDLSNKPSINNVTLSGNKSLSSLGIGSVSSSTPKMNGTASAGTTTAGTSYSAYNHVHPVDTSRQAKITVSETNQNVGTDWTDTGHTISVPAGGYRLVTATIMFNTYEPQGIKIQGVSSSAPISINETTNNYNALSTSCIIHNYSSNETWNYKVYAKAKSAGNERVSVAIANL